MESNEKILDIFENDAIFKRFIENDSSTNEPSSRVIQGMAVSHQLAKLAEGIGMLNHELHSQVSEHYEDLLSQATGIETLEGVLDMMQGRIQSIHGGVDRIRSKVTQPYAEIKKRTRELCRLQDACDLFRTLIRVLHLSSRLKGQLKGKEIAKAAQVIHELDQLCLSVDLNGIEIFEKDRDFFSESRTDIQRDANRMLKVGLESQSQTQVATALQVFHNLGALKSTVSDIISDQEKRLSGEIDDAIDVKRITASASSAGKSNVSPGPGRVTMPSIGNTAAFRAELWTSIGQLMEKIVTRTTLIHHLKRVLDMKKDIISHQSFSQILSENEDDKLFNPLLTFWKLITTKLSSAFNHAAENNTFLKQAFESEFPQLLRIFMDLWSQIKHFIIRDFTSNDDLAKSMSDTSLSAKSSKASLYAAEDERRMLRMALSTFERAYLARSLASLFDPINLVFSNTAGSGATSGGGGATGSPNGSSVTAGGVTMPSGCTSVPCREDIDALLKTISNELHIASIDESLSLTVSRNVSKTLQLFVVKSEQLLVSDGEASQVIGPPTNGQMINVAIVNSLYRLHTSIETVVKDLKDFPEAAINYIESSLRELVKLMVSALQPLLSSVSDAVEAIILTMHNEDFADSQSDDDEDNDDHCNVPCSLYMKELKDFIGRVATTFMPMYECTDFIYDQTLPIAQRCVDLFVRHATLIRPLDKGGKLRLAADFANVEHAVTPLVRNISELGGVYRVLRAIRPMLFESSEHIGNSATLLNGVIPRSVVLHMLFSRAPLEFQSPNQISGWSPSRYSLWMDNHRSENDRLALIRGAIEAYARQVDLQGGVNYAPVYPVMLAILEMPAPST